MSTLDTEDLTWNEDEASSLHKRTAKKASLVDLKVNVDVTSASSDDVDKLNKQV